MPAQNLWKVEIINRDQFGDVWQAINSQVHLLKKKKSNIF